MRTRYIILINFILLTGIFKVYGQQNPSGIEWRSIDTGTYEIVFPADIETLGQRVANLMVHYEKYNYSSIKTKPGKISIVLINNYSEANGFVSFAPLYSHWFTTPASFDSLEWFKGLAIHEGRHITQLNKMHDGAGKSIWYALSGDMGTAVFSIVFIPSWFFEGDAVLMETALTDGGRGRIPAFDLWHRTLELSGVRYSYYESFLGGYKSLYPYADHYRLGYLLCSYVRKHYGKEIWDRVLSGTGRYFIFPNFNWALYNETGLTVTTLYENALNEFNALWEEQLIGLKFTDVEILTSHDEKKWESYYSPVVDGKNGLIAVNFSTDKKLSVVKIEDKKNTKIIKYIPYGVVSSFLHNERNFAAGNGKLLWREQVPDPRWGYRTWSDLRLTDIGSGESELITRKKKFITSTISSDGKVAAGIEYGSDLKYFLSLIDVESREELIREEIRDKGYLFDISISDDKKNIVFAALSDDGNAVLVFDTQKKKITDVIRYTNNERLRSPLFYQNYIIYQSDYSGIDNIYAVDIAGKKRFQVTSRPFGAFFPSVVNGRLYFSDYTKNGYRAVSMLLDRKKWVPIENIERKPINYIDEIADQELKGDNGAIDRIPSEVYPVKDYSHLRNAVNFYGWFWLPFEMMLDSTSVDISLIALSSNVLQTTEMMFSFTRNFNEDKNRGKASFLYKGQYPVVTLECGYGGRAVYLKNKSKESGNDIFKTWNEMTAGGSLSIPLNLSRGVNSTALQFGAGADYLKIFDENDVDHEIYDNMKENGTLLSVKYFFNFSKLGETALNSVIPGTGGVFNISYIHTPYDGDYRGSMISSELVIYLPGITDLQGIKLSGSCEKIVYDTYIFPQKILFPRGYDNLRYEQFYKGTIDYKFPLIEFPVVISEKYGLYIARLFNLLYFRRINCDIFFDYGVGKTGGGSVLYRSAGLEMTMEHNWFSNKYLELEMGLRYSYCFDYENNENMDKHVLGIVVKTPI